MNDRANAPASRGGLAWLVLLCAALVPAAALGQQPDLTGVWTVYRATGPLAGGGGGPAAPLPLRPEVRARVDLYRSVTQGTNYTPGGYCVGAGMPASMNGSGVYPMEIIQRPEQITIIYEAHNEIRRVYFGDRVPPAETYFPERNGRSVGRWEGNVLVVETDRLVEQIDTGFPHSTEARIIERYELSTEDGGRRVLTNTWTMIDPEFLTEPYTAVKRWEAVPNGRLNTFECNEPDWLDIVDQLMSEASARATAD
jgi:hypothetical protein